MSFAAAAAPALQAVTLAVGALHLLLSCPQMKLVMTPMLRAEPWVKVVVSAGSKEASIWVLVGVFSRVQRFGGTFSAVESVAKDDLGVGAGSKVNGSTLDFVLGYWSGGGNGCGGNENCKCEIHVGRIGMGLSKT